MLGTITGLCIANNYGSKEEIKVGVGKKKRRLISS